MRYSSRHGGKTKQDLLDEIGEALRADGAFNVSTGSTEPKGALEAIVTTYGLALDLRNSKPVLGQQIANAAGISWDDSCDSRSSPSGGGSTITFEGLCRLLAAVQQLNKR